jgi:hypothetical protein
MRLLAPIVAAALTLASQAGGAARADAPIAIAQGRAGPFLVTLLGEPTPLRAGPARLSVMVQSGPRDEIVLGASVRLALDPPPGSAPQPAIAADATPANATSGILYAAPVVLAEPGAWSVTVSVARGDERGELRTALRVLEPRGRLAGSWPYLAAPFAFLGLYAVHQLLRARRAA